MFWLLLPCCKICLNFCFQSARVFSPWSIRHSEKSFATSSDKTEETRFQGSTNRVETSCQLTKDSGYVQCYSRSVFSTFPPIPISSSTRLPFPHLSSPIPHSPSPIPPFHIPHPPLSLEVRLSRVKKRRGQCSAWEDAKPPWVFDTKCSIFALNKIKKQVIQNWRSIRQMYTVLWLSVEYIF